MEDGGMVVQSLRCPECGASVKFPDTGESRGEGKPKPLTKREREEKRKKKKQRRLERERFG